MRRDFTDLKGPEATTTMITNLCRLALHTGAITIDQLATNLIATYMAILSAIEPKEERDAQALYARSLLASTALDRMVEARTRAAEGADGQDEFNEALENILEDGVRAELEAELKEINQARWRTGITTPATVIATAEIARALADLYTPAETLEWLTSKQPLLDMAIPLDLIMEQRAIEVMMLIEQIKSGGHL